MKLSKITIKNFKSIENIEFNIKKYGNSYTTILLGVNESGKSNILEAMSYLKKPQEKFSYNEISNQRNETSDYIEICFYFENIDMHLNQIIKTIKGGELLKFKLTNLYKDIFLGKDGTTFNETIFYTIDELTENLFIKKISKENIAIAKQNDEENSYLKLTQKVFKEYFADKIEKIIKMYEPSVLFWKPSEKYLISEVDLNAFKEDTSSNTPLKNIFSLSNIKTEEKIKDEINKITNPRLRRRLMSKLSKDTTKYVTSIWKHKISIDIDITESGICNISIQDNGSSNEHYFYKMNVRSDGFKQFMSLILSLSIEAKESVKTNSLILIDEPETHLHPSGIRDLGKELLEIGKNNYLFVATHSPFLIDKTNQERNIIIKKNNNALTDKKEISEHASIIDNEVLREAFGIEVYKDLLNPHSILVEGASDKIILQKALKIKGITHYGIANGHGSNIDTLASKLNHAGVSILILVDDDEDGQKYKNKIIKIGGIYSKENVFTIRDIVGKIINKGTIEDTLGENFIKSEFIKFYKSELGEDCKYSLRDKYPLIEQIKIFLQKKGKFNNDILDKFKKKISEDFNPTKSTFDTKFPLLCSLVDGINNRISKK